MQGRAASNLPAIGPCMKIAATWHSNSPHTLTGYGTQTRQVVSRMIADGHKIMVAANYGVEAAVTEVDGIPTFPRGYDMWNNDVVGPYFDDWKSQHPGFHHMQFTLFDVHIYDSPRFDNIQTASWVPIDHMPAPPRVLEFLRKPTVTPIAMSKFGKQMIEDAGIACEYAPHAIETSIFKPVGRVKVNGKMMTGRDIMGLPEDAYVVGMFNANKGVNPSRKAWAENFLAFGIFAQSHPDAILYVHSDRDGALGGVKLPQLATACGIRPEQIKFVNQYAFRMGIPAEGLAALYSSTDVALLASMGEGFGITSIEAQACGTPVIVNDFTAQPELVGDGWIVDGQPWWDEMQRAWFNVPFVSSIVDALEEAYRQGHGRSAKAERFVKDNYDADAVYAKFWRPMLERFAS